MSAAASYVQTVLDRFAAQPVRGKSNEWLALCPAHGDRHPSLAITLKTDGAILLCCRSRRCMRDAILDAAGLDRTALLPPKTPDYTNPAPRSARKQTRKTLAKIYDYTDEAGKTLSQVLRWEPKSFTQRAKNANGEYVNSLVSVRRVLYRLPEVLTAVKRGETIFLPEGEEDVNNVCALGLTATTNAMGAAQPFSPEYVEALRGARVVILPDNDEAGRKCRDIRGQALHGNAEVRVLHLPGLPEKGDVSDWIAAGGTKEELLRLAENAPLWMPPVQNTPALPRIETNSRQLRDVSADALDALVKFNDPPQVFIRGGNLVRLHTDEHGVTTAQILSVPALRGILARAADWISTSEKRGAVHVAPPLSVVEDLLSLPEWPNIPVLEGIVTAPVLGADGCLCETPGYHASSRLYYHAQTALILPDTTPTAANIEAARHLLCNELLEDFPFTDAASRAHAVALILLPFVRPMIKGPTPLHLIDAPKAGTGKSLLATACTSLFAVGGASMKNAPSNEEEWGKVLTSVLREGGSHVLIDNARSLNSPALFAALTCQFWTDRVLGTNDTLRLPVRVVWAATCNNVTGNDELTRRSIWIRMDAQTEQPDERTEFRHPNLIEWIAANRGALIGAVLTILRAWMQAGRPGYVGSEPPLGSFESWTRIMGGLLDIADIPGFLANRRELRQRVDKESADWRCFVNAWYDKHNNRAVVAADVFDLALEFMADKLGDGSDRSQKTKLGKLLNANMDRVYDGKRLTRPKVETTGTHKGAACYQLELLTETGNMGNVGKVFNLREESITDTENEMILPIEVGRNLPHVPHVPRPGQCTEAGCDRAARKPEKQPQYCILHWGEE